LIEHAWGAVVVAVAPAVVCAIALVGPRAAARA
jgi:hypothetical protein